MEARLTPEALVLHAAVSLILWPLTPHFFSFFFFDSSFLTLEKEQKKGG